MLPRWFADAAECYEVGARGSEFPFDPTSIHPCIDDLDAPAGTLPAHYGFQDIWAARMIGDRRPSSHVDVGSRLDGFVTHLLAMRIQVRYVDVRPLDVEIDGLACSQDDAKTLATIPSDSIESLSCLHVAEHVGIPRYSLDVDPDGMTKCMRSLARVLTWEGRLYFACPIGRQRVVFNAHRIASPLWVMRQFDALGLTLTSFAAVDDAGKFHAEAEPKDYEGAEYACGCFEYVKRST